MHRPVKSFGRGLPKMQTQLDRAKRSRLSLTDSGSAAGGQKTAARRANFRPYEALKLKN